MTVVYACIFPVAGSQMLCSQPRRCCFLFGKQTCFSSVALESKQEILDQQTSLTDLITIKTRTVFCKCIFPSISKIHEGMNFSFWNLFCTLLCIFIYLLFVLLLPCSCNFYWLSGFWLTWCFCVSFVAFSDVVVRILSEADGIFFMCICEMLLAQRQLPQMCLQRCAAQCGRVGAGLQVLCGGCGKGRVFVVSRSHRLLCDHILSSAVSTTVLTFSSRRVDFLFMRVVGTFSTNRIWS